MAALSTRKDDLRLDVVQHQQEKTLTIIAADKDFEHHIATSQEELVGKDLRTILPRNIQDMIENYVEFGDEMQDLAAVLGKISKFGLLHKKGREIRFSLKILRDMSDGSNPQFQLHLSRLKVMESLCQQLGLPEVSEKDVMDDDAGMPTRASFLRHLAVVTQAVEMGKVNATLALLRVDQYNTITHQHGQEASSTLLKQLGQVIRTNLREDDVMGYAEPNRVGVLLLETKKENAKIPLNRIRWMFAANPVEIKGEKIPVTLTAGYIELQGKGAAATLIEQCQKLLREAELNVGNTIIEPTA